MKSTPLRTIASALLLAAVSTSPTAEEKDRWTLSNPVLPTREPQQEPGHPVPAGWYDQFIEVALSDEMFELGYRQLTHRKRDYYGLNFIANDEDDFLLSGRLVRQGQITGQPLRFGVGIGAYGVWLDEPDEAVYAVALMGVAEYDLQAMYPTTVSADLAIAPKITTFGDGEDLLEAKVRLNVDLSAVASGFLGARLIEVDTDTGSADVDKGLHLGIRLAL